MQRIGLFHLAITTIHSSRHAFTCVHFIPDICIFEEREARWAKKVFDKFTRGLRNDEVDSADLKHGDITVVVEEASSSLAAGNVYVGASTSDQELANGENLKRAEGNDEDIEADEAKHESEREEKSESKNRSQEVKVTLHPNGIPERFGESMVIKMFKDWKEHDPNWHYLDAYNKFKELYPRVATGDPTKRWSTTYFSKHYSTRKDPGQTESDYGSVRIVMRDLTPNRSDTHQSSEEPKETTNLI